MRLKGSALFGPAEGGSVPFGPVLVSFGPSEWSEPTGVEAEVEWSGGEAVAERSRSSTEVCGEHGGVVQMASEPVPTAQNRPERSSKRRRSRDPCAFGADCRN